MVEAVDFSSGSVGAVVLNLIKTMAALAIRETITRSSRIKQASPHLRMNQYSEAKQKLGGLTNRATMYLTTSMKKTTARQMVTFHLPRLENGEAFEAIQAWLREKTIWR